MIDLKPELQAMIDNIAKRNMYSGNRIPDSVIRLFQIEQKEIAAGWLSAGILVPYWIPVLEHGRGPRRTDKDYGLVKIIYRWMERRNMFRSTDPVKKIREARFLTLYINRYGTKHFRSGVFVDIYTTVRQQTIEAINRKFAFEIGRITYEIL
jgi:hypothetical protein